MDSIALRSNWNYVLKRYSNIISHREIWLANIWNLVYSKHVHYKYRKRSLNHYFPLLRSTHNSRVNREGRNYWFRKFWHYYGVHIHQTLPSYRFMKSSRFFWRKYLHHVFLPELLQKNSYQNFLKFSIENFVGMP